MKRINAIVEDKRGSWFFFFTVIMLLLSMATINAQTFNLGGREYVQVEGLWYVIYNGRIGDQVIPERIVIQIKKGMDITQLDLSLINLSNLQVITGLIAENFHVVKVTSNLDPFVSATALSTSIDVVDIEFDALGEWTGTPDDPKWSNQWNLKTSKLNMPAAWDISTGSSSIILAIIDTGFEYNHEDLSDNIWSGIGWDFHDNDSYPFPDYNVNQDHHGTAVAGIAAAVTDNGKGVAGIAGGWHPTQGVKIMYLRPDFWVDENNDPHPYESSVAEAVTYAYQNGAKIINLSLAYENSHSALTSAINTAVNNYDVVVVSSSGNKGGETGPPGDYWYVRFPASLSNTIAVGATEYDDTRWEGYSQGSCYGPELDLMAPTFVWTTDLEGGEGVSGNYRSNFGGTSAAAPHVAGLTALIRSLYPDMPLQKVKEAMTNTAVDLGDPGRDDYYGYGRIDAYAALSYEYPPPAEPQNFHVEWVPTFGGWNPKLVWNANTEIDLAGYKLRRSLDWGPWITIANLSKSATNYIDEDVLKSNEFRNDKYAHYKLIAYNIAGSESDYAGPLVVRHIGLIWKRLPENPSVEAVPETFILPIAYPNPFNAATTINYGLPEDAFVNIKIYDIMGREVTTLVNGFVNAGFKEIIWDGKNSSGQSIPSGMYFYRLDARAVESGERFHHTRKMVLLR